MAARWDAGSAETKSLLEPACSRSCRSLTQPCLGLSIIQSCITLVQDVPFLITDGQMTKGSETTQSEPPYRSQRNQPESRKQRLRAHILLVHLCLQPHALLQEQTGKTEGLFWFASNTSEPRKATGRAFKMPFVLAPACKESPLPQAGASEARAYIFFHFHKSSFPSIYWMCCAWYWVGTQPVSNCKAVTPLPPSKGPRSPL